MIVGSTTGAGTLRCDNELPIRNGLLKGSVLGNDIGSDLLTTQDARAEVPGRRDVQRQKLPNDNSKRSIAYFFNEHFLNRRSSVTLGKVVCEGADVPKWSDCPAAGHQIDDQHDYGDHQQEVNQAACNMEAEAE